MDHLRILYAYDILFMVILTIGRMEKSGAFPLFPFYRSHDSKILSLYLRLSWILPFHQKEDFVVNKKVLTITEQLALPILEKEGLELVEIEFKKEGSNWFLRLFIDKEGGVDIDDCGRVSEQLSKRLDEVNPIPQAYFLEVSSPGAERPLRKPKDFERAIDHYVHISLYEPISGAKEWEGYLRKYEDDSITVEVEQEMLTFPMTKVAKARLAILF